MEMVRMRVAKIDFMALVGGMVNSAFVGEDDKGVNGIRQGGVVAGGELVTGGAPGR